MNRFLKSAVVALLLVALVANAALGIGLWATREPAAKPLTADRIKAGTRPALMLVQSNYAITTSLPDFTIPQSKINVLVDQLVAMAESGKIPATEEAFRRAALNLILAHPDSYFVPGPRIKDETDIVSTGTGFFVTQDGYFVTAAHVVDADRASIRTEALALAKDPQSLADARTELANEFAKDGIPTTAAQLTSMVGFIESWNDKYLSIDNVDAKYYLGTGQVTTGDSLVGKGARATVVKIDPTVGGRDIAIMKASVTGSVPALQLASGAVVVGQSTYAIGYPRQGFLDEAAPLDQTIDPTMTTGKVLGPSSDNDGAWGTNATFTHGDSGGPVLDADGHVLGIVDYTDSSGTGYFISSQFVRADIASASIHLPQANEPKSLTAMYYKALAEGDVQRYKPELSLLQDVQAQSSWHAFVKDDIVSVQGQILAGNDKTPPDFASYVVPAAGVSGGVIVLALIVWIGLAIAGRRRRPVGATALAAAADVESTPVAAVETGESIEPALASVAAPSQPEVELVTEPHDVMRDSEPVALAQAAATSETVEEERPETPTDAPTA